MARRLLLALILIAGAAALARVALHPAAADFLAPAAMSVTPAAPRFESRFVSLRHDVQTHAASLIELRDGRLRAFWYAGSREGAEDVTIRSAVFDRQRGEWGVEQVVADRVGTSVGLARYVKKLGNPVPARAADGSLWLYYVTVSVGGWAGSSITALHSRDDGETWSTPQRLVTSPFLNVSTLVKGAPFHYADGTLGLPVYHEFIDKFAEVLRLDGEGRVIDKQRLTSGRFSLQPVVLVRSATQAVALMRNSGDAAAHRVFSVRTGDGGRHWSEAMPLSLPNPDSAVGGLVLPDGRLLAILNDSIDNRDTLALAVSSDGGDDWRIVAYLEEQARLQKVAVSYAQRVSALAAASDPHVTDAAPFAASAARQMCQGTNCGFEFSYPYAILAADGEIDLVYTWNRAFIKHVRFNLAWLDQQIGPANHAVR